MRRLALACAASVAVYAALFGLVLDRPLALGFVKAQIDRKLARARPLPSPKIVILAGSNGPYSHRCEVIGPMLGMPCENAGVAVGIGLDYLFARWSPLLHAGDVLYLPMEFSQYARGRAESALGPDAAIMFRHDRGTLAGLAPHRWIAALFAFDLRSAVMSAIETALVAGGVADPRAAFTGETDAMGDHVGHTLALAAADAGRIARLRPFEPRAATIAQGYGAHIIAGFVGAMIAKGVRVAGGLPTGFADDPPGAATLDAVRAIYARGGAAFLALPNLSRYPRADFFDSADHLSEPCQIAHSVRVARGLGALLAITIGPAPGGLAQLARNCPGRKVSSQ